MQDGWPTPEQLSQIADDAQSDDVLWQHVKANEIQIEAMLSAAIAQGKNYDDHDFEFDFDQSLPNLGIIAEQLIERRFGEQSGIITGVVVLELRRRARIELGLPV